MKHNIETSIKEALGNYELPYAEGAWEAFSKNLPVVNAPFYKKWWFAASIAIVAISGVFLAFNETSKNQDNNPQIAESTASNGFNGNTESNANASHSNHSAFQSENKPENIQSSSSELKNKVEQNRNNTVSYSNLTGTNGASNPANSNASGGSTSSNGNIKNETVGNQYTTDTYFKVNVPTLACLGDEINVHNPNPQKQISVYPVNGKAFSINAGETASIKTTDAGTIRVTSGKYTSEIIVKTPAGKLYVEASELYYENGIPSVKFDVTGTVNNLKWDSRIKDTESSNGTFIVHPYTEQTVAARVSSKDANGCTLEEVSSIHLDEKYNLLAPSGFKPLDYDSRNNRFMPFALTQRNTPFELVIINPKNNQIMHRTSNANDGWDGTNRTTGELVSEGTVWIWKVILKYPNPGEPNEYSGTVTRL